MGPVVVLEDAELAGRCLSLRADIRNELASQGWPANEADRRRCSAGPGLDARWRRPPVARNLADPRAGLEQATSAARLAPVAVATTCECRSAQERRQTHPV